MALVKNGRCYLINAVTAGLDIADGLVDVNYFILMPNGTDAANFSLYAAASADADFLIAEGRTPGTEALVGTIGSPGEMGRYLSQNGLYVVLTGTGSKLFLYLA